MRCITKKSKITRGILTYLTRHPAAQDTLEGVMEWWLLEQEIVNQTATVKDALADLMNEGLILERKGKDTQTRFCVNPRRARQISRMLE
jgi:hypothetical protein